MPSIGGKMTTYYGTKRIIKYKSSPLTPTTFSLIHFIIILRSTPRPSTWSLSLKFPHQNLAIHFSHIGATCFLPLYLLIFVSPKSTWWGIQIQLLAVQFFATSSYLLRLRCCIFLNTLFRFLFRKINIRINRFTDSTYLLSGCHCREKRLIALLSFVRPSIRPSIFPSIRLHASLVSTSTGRNCVTFDIRDFHKNLSRKSVCG